MSALVDRRQNARETYWDQVSLPERHEPAAFEEAIETATRVRITDEMIDSVRAMVPYLTPHGVRTILAYGFTSAGFEVVQ